MEEKTEKWIMPNDVKVVETDKPEEILHKYLAAPMVKKWTETYKDEDTGESVSIERSEILFNEGLYIDENIFPKIMFSLQAGEVSKVKVSDHLLIMKRANSQVKRYIVSLSDLNTKCNVYTTLCKTPEDAAQMVADYNTIYGLNVVFNNYSVLESKTTGMVFIDKDVIGNDFWGEVWNKSYNEVKVKVTNEWGTLPEPFNEERYFKLSVNTWNEVPGKFEKLNDIYVVQALTCEDAVKLLKHRFDERDKDNLCSLIRDIVSVSKAPIDFVIPASYAKQWCTQKYGEDYFNNTYYEW